MIAVNNGIKTFVFERVDDDKISLNMAHIMSQPTFSGVCYELITYPSEKGSNTILVNSASAVCNKNSDSLVPPITCQIDLPKYAWYTNVSEGSEIYEKIRNEIYGATECLGANTKPGVDFAKIAAIKEALAELTAEEIQALRGK